MAWPKQFVQRWTDHISLEVSCTDMDSVNESIDSLVACLKRGEVIGSFDIAMKTVLVLRKVVGSLRWSNAKELMDFIRVAGKKLMDAQPSEAAVGNMVRRILKLIREEYAAAVGKDEGEFSVIFWMRNK